MPNLTPPLMTQRMQTCFEDLRANQIDLLAMDRPQLTEFVRLYRTYFRAMLGIEFEDEELVNQCLASKDFRSTPTSATTLHS